MSQSREGESRKSGPSGKCEASESCDERGQVRRTTVEFYSRRISIIIAPRHQRGSMPEIVVVACLPISMKKIASSNS